MSTATETTWVDPGFQDISTERPIVAPGTYFVEVLENTSSNGIGQNSGKPWAKEDLRAKILRAADPANEKSVGLHVRGGFFRGSSQFKRLCTNAGMANWPQPGGLTGTRSWVIVKDVQGFGARASETFANIVDSPEPDKVMV